MAWNELLPDLIGLDLVWPSLAVAFLAGYLCGSVPSGVIVARAFGLGDLRRIGSGNIGATNVLRTGSKKAAATTLFLDLLKGWAPVALMLAFRGEFPAALTALGAVIGHVFPIWLRFRGGKGVATFLGVTLGLSPFAGLLCCLTWLGAAALFRISSLSALIMTLAAPVWLWILGDRGAIWATALLVILVWVKHGANIGRLLRGTEPKIGAH